MKQKLNLAYKLGMYGSLAIIIICVIGAFTYPALIAEIAKSSAELGVYALILMLLSKSGYLILIKYKIKNQFLRLNNTFQREQGLIVFNLITAHVLYNIINLYQQPAVLIPELLSVLIPIIILIYLELTSFTKFKHLIPNWKKTHSIVWIIVPLLITHLIVVGSGGLKMLFLTLGLFLIAIIELLAHQKKRGKLHLLILILGVIITVFTINFY